jgi:PAS domain S-box-containing protein
MSDHDFLSALCDALPVPIYVVDTNLMLTYFNEAALQTADRAGFDRTKLVGHYIREALPFITDEVEHNLRRVIATGETLVDNLWYEISGRFYAVEATRFPITLDGMVRFVGVAYRDVTELRHTHEELRASEETARALMNSSSESMFLVGEDERLIAANATAAGRLGIPAGRIEGLSIFDILPAEIAKSRLANFRRVRDTGEPLRFTDERMGRRYDTTMFPVPNAAGGPRRVAIYSRDVTENEAMISALRDSEMRFREFFDQTPVPTYIWRWNGTTLVLRDANRAAHEITAGRINTYYGQTAEHMYRATYPDIVRDIRASYFDHSHIVREMRYHLLSVERDVYFEVHYVYIAPDEVMIHTVDLTARREAETELQKSYAQLEQRVAERTRELGQLNEQLHLEREALNQKQAAMRELIAHIDDNRTEMAETIQANLQHIIGPILNNIESRGDKNVVSSIRFLRESLDDLLSPHLTDLRRHYPKLTANEIDLCNLIRSGKTCKEIAELRGRSEQTILKQRKVIRRKLGLKDDKTNLRDFLTAGSIRH